jgi:hypothetical protein
MKKIMWFWIVIGAIVLVAVVYLVGQGSNNTTSSNIPPASVSTTNNQSQSQATDIGQTQTSPTYSQHASDYVYSYLSALSALYNSTQDYTNVQQSGITDPSMVMLTSLGEVVNDLQEADSAISPYINDNNKAISATAGLLNPDILIVLRDANQAKSALTYGINNQDTTSLNNVKTSLAAFAADSNTMKIDIQKALVGVQYVIQNPVNNDNPTGQIDYAISPDNRSFLLKQIGVLFPVPLDSITTQSNVYLLFAKEISRFMSSNTYEQEASEKII